MIIEIIFAIIQAFTEFLPISSSGHLTLFSYLIDSTPNIFFFSVLHFASLMAVLIYFRKDILNLFSFRKEVKKYWFFLIIATIPAAIFGFFGRNLIGSFFNSSISVAISFLFTGFVLFLTKFVSFSKKLGLKESFSMGFFQILGLFPGISRSGITTSTGMLFGVKGEDAGRFSFLLFIPLSIGALFLELKDAYFNLSLVVSFIVCFVLSYLSIKIFFKIIKKGLWWIFGIYCISLGILIILFF
jgi:undecaprenyl-diphosphatase